jgi:hypothetical protein
MSAHQLRLTVEIEIIVELEKPSEKKRRKVVQEIANSPWAQVTRIDDGHPLDGVLLGVVGTQSFEWVN